MNEPKKPIPSKASKDQIHYFAESVASKLNFRPGDAIEPLVQTLGGRIAYKNPTEYKSRLPESIVVRRSNDFTIYLPSMTSPERDRFTIAHELGHLVLHYPLVAKLHPDAVMVATRWVNENDAEQQRAEWEANWFAAGFLMSGKDFKEAFRTLSGDLGLGSGPINFV